VASRPPLEKARSRDRAAAYGTDGRTGQGAREVRQQAPELHEEVKAGARTLLPAMTAVQRPEQHEELQRQAAKSPPAAIRIGGSVRFGNGRVAGWRGP
jgi:hypothetical protein